MTVSPFREPHDFYPTPSEATRALLSVEAFPGPIWEPAAGDGAIARVLIARGHHVVSTDLIARGWGTAGVDFLSQTENRARHIITNPPYGRGLADRFIRHALRLAHETEGSVAMLLDLASLAHPIRHGLYTRNPPANVYILDELVCAPPGKTFRNSPAQTRFAWLVWRPGHTGRSELWWLSTAPFRD